MPKGDLGQSVEPYTGQASEEPEEISEPHQPEKLLQPQITNVTFPESTPKEKTGSPYLDRFIGTSAAHEEGIEEAEQELMGLIERGAQERFKSRGLEVAKTPRDIQIIQHAEQSVRALLDKYGRDKDIIAGIDDIHLFKPGGVSEFTGSKFAVGFYSPQTNKVLIDRSSDVETAMTTFHELIHLKSYKAMQVAKGKESDLAAEYRSGIRVRSRDGNELYFRDIEEAITGLLERRFFEEEIVNNPLFKEEVEELKSKGRLPNYSRENELNNLDSLIDDLWVENQDDFGSREEILDLFIDAKINGNLMPIGRLVESTFGKGSFRRLGKGEQVGTGKGGALKEERAEEREAYQPVSDEELKTRGQRMRNERGVTHIEKRSSRGEGVSFNPTPHERSAEVGPEQTAEQLAAFFGNEAEKIKEKISYFEGFDELSEVGENTLEELRLKLKNVEETRYLYINARLNAAENLEKEVGQILKTYEQMSLALERKLRSRGLWSHANTALEQFKKMPWIDQVSVAVGALGSVWGSNFEQLRSDLARSMKEAWSEAAQRYMSQERLDALATQKTAATQERAVRSFTSLSDMTESQREAQLLALTARAEKSGVVFDRELETSSTLWQLLWETYKPLMEKEAWGIKPHEEGFFVGEMVRELQLLPGKEQHRLLGLTGAGTNIDGVLKKGTSVSLKEFHKSGIWHVALRALGQLTDLQHQKLKERYGAQEIALGNDSLDAASRYLVPPEGEQMFSAAAEDIAATGPGGLGARFSKLSDRR